jgi:hypothetical protein
MQSLVVVLTNGTLYLYKLAAVDAFGNQSRLTEQAGATPRTETEPPDGAALINNGAARTGSRVVTLTLAASPDTVAIKFSNDPTFPGATWAPFAPSRTWMLPARIGKVYVYVRLKDAAGNESDTFLDSIWYEPYRVYLPVTMRSVSTP